MKRLHLASVDSTQTWLRDRIGTLDDPTLLIADEQTGGRGQFSRSWVSPPGNLYLSIYFTLPPNQRGLERLAQLIALAGAEALTHRGYSVVMKWPNDLLIDGKKVGGVLCEVVSERAVTHVVASIGINLFMSQEALVSINQPATALEWCSGQLPSRDLLAEAISSRFLELLALFRLEGFQLIELRIKRFLAR